MWAVQAILAIVFMMAGSMRLVKDKGELAEKMGWAENFSQSTIWGLRRSRTLGTACISPVSTTRHHHARWLRLRHSDLRSGGTSFVDVLRRVADLDNGITRRVR